MVFSRTDGSVDVTCGTEQLCHVVQFPAGSALADDIFPGDEEKTTSHRH